jgi:Tfp pilus assembly protein PilV
MFERRSRRGFSLLEAVVAVVILAACGIPIYQLLSTGVKGAERTRDQMIAFAVAEKMQEKLNAMMRGSPDERKRAIEFANADPKPLTTLPFFPELRTFVERTVSLRGAAVATSAAPKTGDAARAVEALGNFQYTVTSNAEKPAGAPEATFLTKQIRIQWKDAKNKDRSVVVDATFANPSIYFETVKSGYANSKSITDRIMQKIMNRRNQPLVKIDASKLLDSLQYPVKSNEFLEPDPWYEGYLKQASGLAVNRRLGTEGQTSDERMAVKEAALAQFFGLTAEQAKIITYDLKDEAEEIVKKIENLPPYSDSFKNVTGVDGVGVRSPGKGGAYSCLNCHAPQFFATLDEGYLSLPPDFLAYKPSGVEKTGKEWLTEYLDALKKNKAIGEGEHKKFIAHLNRNDVGIFSGATSPR